jgi:hypothetical protein
MNDGEYSLNPWGWMSCPVLSFRDSPHLCFATTGALTLYREVPYSVVVLLVYCWSIAGLFADSDCGPHD